MIKLQFIILCFICLACSLSSTVKDGQSKFQAMFVQKLDGDSLNIIRAEKSAYIFVGGYSCKECITKLEHVILETDSTYKIHVILRIAPGTRIFSKKSEIHRVSKLVDSRSFYFDVGPSAGLGKYEGGLFERFDISATPAVLFNFTNREPAFVNYLDLFGRPDELLANDIDSKRCAQQVARVLEND